LPLFETALCGACIFVPALQVMEAGRAKPPLFPEGDNTLTDAIADVQRYAQSQLTEPMREDLNDA
jgi:hypothetical protein